MMVLRHVLCFFAFLLSVASLCTSASGAAAAAEASPESRCPSGSSESDCPSSSAPGVHTPGGLGVNPSADSTTCTTSSCASTATSCTTHPNNAGSPECVSGDVHGDTQRLNQGEEQRITGPGSKGDTGGKGPRGDPEKLLEEEKEEEKEKANERHDSVAHEMGDETGRPQGTLQTGKSEIATNSPLPSSSPHVPSAQHPEQPSDGGVATQDSNPSREDITQPEGPQKNTEGEKKETQNEPQPNSSDGSNTTGADSQENSAATVQEQNTAEQESQQQNNDTTENNNSNRTNSDTTNTPNKEELTTTTTTTTLPPELTNNKKGDADSSSSISSSVWVRVPLLIVVTLACILVC
ncbi:uncharacterized protein TM35_001271090 [Trypanosoma theileri]|uniref:Mucin TcMUCII n=1 Tax=Trypanosoma theileri TaxID=67003 RepID=A0A1X0NDP5_9TRYP|nr:uncharacterized protein TM35_001271090 [Trypanosoma theileri]ORC81203.1 hypothetical protein TM35_001271090 [Trypanosoma theileri]